MGLDPVRNFAVGTLTAGIAAGDTTFNLNTGEGSLFPLPSSEGAFNGVIWNATDYDDPLQDAQRELVRVTTRSTDAFTVTRGQESTSAVAHNTVGKAYKLAVVVTRKLVQDVDARLVDGIQSYAVDTGAANAYVITLSPAPTAYATGQGFRFKAVNANTTAATLNVNGLGVKTIKGKGGADLASGEISAGQMCEVLYDGTNFQLVTQTISPAYIQGGVPTYGVDTGSANAIAVALSPAITTYAAGLRIIVKVVAANTATTTVNLNSLGTKTLKDKEGSVLTGGELAAGAVYEMIYDGTDFLLINVLSISEVSLNTGNGVGATNTKILRFTNTVRNVGTSMTYADSAANGGSITINKAGTYAFMANGGNGTQTGLSKNSSQLTTAIGSITAADRLAMMWGNGVNSMGSAAASVYCNVNDVIRAHNDGSADVQAYTQFRAIRVA